MEILDDLLENAYVVADHSLVQLKHTDLMPMWDMVDRKGMHYLVGTPWENERHKRAVEVLLRKKVRELDIVAYSFISECWMVILSEAEQEMGIKMQPRHHQNRVEIVMAVATDGKDTKWRQWEIMRNWKHEIIKLEERDCEHLNKADKVVSWTTSLLNDEEE